MSARRVHDVDLCVIGAGSAGLSVAAGAAQLGLSVVLFEKGEMGGDCLNTGCVPSKALIAAADAAHAMRSAGRLGLAAVEPAVDWDRVRAHLTGVIEAIAPIDSQERFEGLGCIVVREHARFVDRETVESETARVRARRFVIAAGATALIPPIPGLAETPHLTNETVFEQESLPESLIVLGGGVIGVELGQAFARLGSKVTIVEGAALMGAQEPEVAPIVRASLQADGVTLMEGVKAASVARDGDGVAVTLEDGAVVRGARLLVAVGRKVRLDGLGLEAAGVEHDRKGIVTDEGLRSVSNRRVWAAGDIAGREQLTHAAGFHASLFIRTALFKAPAKAAVAHMPAVAYCDPEVARVGLTEAEARKRHGDAVKTTIARFDDNDRARAERADEGFCKLVIGKGGKLLGATIVGEAAGEAIQIACLAISKGLSVSALAGMIAPYPTRGEIVKRAAGMHFTPTLFSPRTRFLVSILKRFG